ncbi:MAG: hypothetical protein JXC32_06580, partial [Anaerolineae bacterium]|nr:hypothetical protein [Anaerolineae bacterium]
MQEDGDMRLESNDRRAGSRLVALLGESLLMDSVEAILNRVREHPHSLDVVRLPVMSADQGPPPRLMPDLIISDLSAVQLCDVSHYLDYFPYIPFLGIDPTSHRVLALSC